MTAKGQKLTRRVFLKALTVIPVYAALGSSVILHAEPRRFAKLVDTQRCIGCKRCMSACKRWNTLKVERNELISDRDTDLTANNWVVVNLLVDSRNRTAKTYIHFACQHCIQPACAGVCPVKAITKLPEGPVVINEKKCIGCRYCFQACPFKVPRFDFGKRVTRKCHMCYDRVPLLNYMKPACVAACPVGALYFNFKDEVVREAKRRAAARGGASYIMGLTEAGGTDMLTILPTNPRELNIVVAPQKIINEDLDKIRITAAGIMGSCTLTGLMAAYAAVTAEKDKTNHDEPD